MTSTPLFSPISLCLFFFSRSEVPTFFIRLTTRFLELGSILEPGRPPKTDKAAILIDAVRMVTQLRGEAQKLKDSNSSLQEKIKELKVILHSFVFFPLHVENERL